MTVATVDIPAAFEFLFSPPLGDVRFRVAYGGRGSAKSWAIARALLIHGTERPLRILCAREYQASIKDSVHKLLSDQIDTMGLQGLYEVQQAGIFGTNGTEFLFKGLRHSINEIKSTEGIDICWVEEAQAVGKNSWDVLIPTIRQGGSEIWVSFNPDQERDDTYRRFITEPEPRAIVRRVGYDDNPFLPAVLREAAEHSRATDLEEFDHVWGGNPWTRSKSAIFADKCVVQDFTPEALWSGPYFGADWGFANDPSVLVKLWVHAGDLYLEYAEGDPKMDNDATAARFKAVPGASEHEIHADAARPETIHEMRRRGLRVTAAPKWDGSVKDGIAHIRTYGRVVIHPRATMAIEEAKLYRYKVDPLTDQVLPVPVDKHNHCLAGETLVDTTEGPFRIDHLVGREGAVPTLEGERRFHSVRMTAEAEPVYRVTLTDGRSFRATGDHPVLTQNGWRTVLSLSSNDAIITLDVKRYDGGVLCHQQGWSSTAESTGWMSPPDTTSATDAVGRQRTSIGMSGLSIPVPSRTASRFTTETAKTTTDPRHLSAFRGHSTVHSTQPMSQRRSRSSSGGTWNAPDRLQPNGIAASTVVGGTPNTQAGYWQNGSTPSSVSSAAPPLSEPARSSRDDSARTLARLLGVGNPVSMTFNGNAATVAEHSRSAGIPIRPTVRGNAGLPAVEVLRVEPDGIAPVFNMEVDTAHHYPVMGGLVVHNCWDALRYALHPLIRQRSFRQVAVQYG